MKVSEILKKVSTIGKGTKILVILRESKDDNRPEIIILTGDTPDDEADQFIKAAEEYNVQEMEFDSEETVIYAIRAEKRTQKPKPEKPEPAAGQDQTVETFKQSVAELKQAVKELFQEIRAAFHSGGGRVDKEVEIVDKKNIFRRARAAVARFLKMIFRKGDFSNGSRINY